MNKSMDCVVCGTCTVDILVKPIDLQQPLGGDRLHLVEPIEATTGGIVSNAGMALAKLGNRTGAMTGTGIDPWAEIIKQRFRDCGIDARGVVSFEKWPTSTTVVLIDEAGQRSFAHCPGAPSQLDLPFFEKQFEWLAASRAVLIGYYSLMPKIEPDLAGLLSRLRQAGCLTALDSAGVGGSMDPLCELLPHLDIYFPSLGEAENQTGCSDPQQIIDVFRQHGARGYLGVKMGAMGVAFSVQPGHFEYCPAIQPPRPIVDTTGAGDAFLAGLLTGLLREMSPSQAIKLGCAVAAVSITGRGASSQLPTLSYALELTATQ